MREILFRGKRTDTGKWVEGQFVPSDMDDWYMTYIIANAKWVDDDEELDLLDTDIYRVAPETVGQYTGLTDKNGREIFEGDIVHCQSYFDNANMVVIFECGQFRMVLAENYSSYQTNSGYHEVSWFDKEVIGNIHDNPELLNGGKNNG